jgi:hypothetical protein
MSGDTRIGRLRRNVSVRAVVVHRPRNGQEIITPNPALQRTGRKRPAAELYVCAGHGT